MIIKSPQRVQHTYTQSLSAPPERVFPLLCPVMEAEWVPGWMPQCVVSSSGVMEEGCLFVTQDEIGDATWIALHHDPQTFRLDLLKVVPNHIVCQYDIRLAGMKDGRTAADITYTCTAISDHGETFVKGLTASWYTDFMQRWEHALNHYLMHGEMIAMD